jgi:hypothetical protein
VERELDLTPRHLVDWLRAELADGGGRRLEVRATREFFAEAGPAAGAALDAEDGMEVMTTVGLLEVAPAIGGAHWVLRLRVEDRIGSHLPEEGSVPDGPEEIGIEVFEAVFLAGEDEAEASVTVEADSAADGGAFDRVLARIVTDRHRRRG